MASSSHPPPPPPHFLITPKPDPDGPLLPPNPQSLALTPELCDIPAPGAGTLPRRRPGLRPPPHRIAAPSPSPRRPAPYLHRRAPPPPPPLPQPGSSPKSPSAKKRARPASEMVRATNLSLADHLHFRSLVRRARLTFEALRGIYLRQQPSAGIRNRADLRASSKMLSDGRWLHREHRIVGHIPGVLVGDAFFYRAELCVVGLHTAPQAGIGYIPASIVGEGPPRRHQHRLLRRLPRRRGHRRRPHLHRAAAAVSATASTTTPTRHSSAANLALHNSFQYGVEVRVIRGHTSDTNRKVYVYDGLYRVVGSTFGPGKSGRDVCKFKLVRLPGQDDLGSKTWTSAKLLKDAIDAKMPPPSYISLDMSGGKEPVCVPVSNQVDDDRSPLDFEYTVCPEFPLLALVKRKRACHCVAGCGLSCRCDRKNAGGSPYNEDGTLNMGRPVVYECGALCGCPMTCVNRVTQRGMKHRLEVFRSTETEWGVRTLDLIQPGYNPFVVAFAAVVIAKHMVSGNVLNRLLRCGCIEQSSEVIETFLLAKEKGKWDGDAKRKLKADKPPREDWRQKSKPVPPGAVYPAKDHCSRCGLCDTYYVAHVKTACAFLGDGMSCVEDLEPVVHGRGRKESMDEMYFGVYDQLLYARKIQPVEVDNGTREGLDKFLKAASSEPETVLHYEFMQDYKVHLKHLDGHTEEVPYFCLPANDLVDVIAPSCYRNERGREMLSLVKGLLESTPTVSSGARQPFVMETVKADDAAKLGKGPSKPAPRLVGNILAFLLNLVGPKGLEFARYSLDYHTIRNYLHVRRAWGKQRAEQHMPGYAKKIVEAYDGEGRINSMLQDSSTSGD
ncbi:hypothetical protein PR202_ga21846 [Eleusine coracana subsp. coracana]|uniref:Uncharacterized protein n=1 Tax=Eleusine coracana subsp. coracana TaxID=191504 RepID=A0AAV5D237_ELECO|nr:hypothetical protein PR202_ga21846 [Eleusine coracana subsp. coracana]